MKQQQNCCIVSKEQGSLKTEKIVIWKQWSKKLYFACNMLFFIKKSSSLFYCRHMRSCISPSNGSTYTTKLILTKTSSKTWKITTYDVRFFLSCPRPAFLCIVRKEPGGGRPADGFSVAVVSDDCTRLHTSYFLPAGRREAVFKFT